MNWAENANRRDSPGREIVLELTIDNLQLTIKESLRDEIQIFYAENTVLYFKIVP